MSNPAEDFSDVVFGGLDELPDELIEGDYAEAPEGWRTLAEMEASVSAANKALLLERGDDDEFRPGAFIVTWTGMVVPVFVDGSFGAVEQKDAWREVIEQLIVKTRAQRVGMFMVAWALKIETNVQANPAYKELIDRAKEVAAALTDAELKMFGLKDRAEAEAKMVRIAGRAIAQRERASRPESLGDDPERVEVLVFQGEERGGQKYLHTSYEFVRDGGKTGKIVGFEPMNRDTEVERSVSGRYSNLFPALTKSVH